MGQEPEWPEEDEDEDEANSPSHLIRPTIVLPNNKDAVVHEIIRRRGVRFLQSRADPCYA
jgi:hypothetical protein